MKKAGFPRVPRGGGDGRDRGGVAAGGARMGGMGAGRRWAVLIATGLLIQVVLGVRPVVASPEGGAFTIVVLPDTQIYAWRYPEIFMAQTRWIARNVEGLQIRYVIHVGDVVQHNSEEEWARARAAFSLLDGRVPYAVALGNHDYGPGGSARDRTTLFERYFPREGFTAWPTFGGVYDREPDKLANCFHRFQAGGRDWLILVLEFGPRDDVVRWAKGIVSRYRGDQVILVTHAYLDNDGRRYDRRLHGQHFPPHGYPLAGGRGGMNTGEDLWRRIVAPSPNVVMVVCGHVCESIVQVRTRAVGNPVCEMLVDYQDRPRGGEGWLRLLRFLPRQGKVRVRDYSPLLDRWMDRGEVCLEPLGPGAGRKPRGRSEGGLGRWRGPSERNDVRGTQAGTDRSGVGAAEP